MVLTRTNLAAPAFASSDPVHPQAAQPQAAQSQAVVPAVSPALDSKWKARALDYVIAAGSIGVAISVTMLLWGTLNRNPFALFYIAVMLSAWRGGFGPGLLASILALISIDFFLMPSFFSGSIHDVVQASTFVGIAGLLSWLNHARDRAMADLQQAKEEADDANAAKDQFLAVLSHELRTPLTPVLGLAMMLEHDDTLSEDRRADATIIRRNIELEARLIDDLLDITRIRQGKLSLNRRAVDVVALLDDVLRICEPDAQGKNIHVRTISNGPRVVYGDPARLQQIVWNVLKNAIKFTPENGHVTINVSDTADGQVAIDVIDTGIGIEPATLAHVFKAFEQGGSKVTRKFGGIGLGLAISKALAEAHGGTLTAASEGQGRGACFTLTLSPLRHATLPETSSPAKESTTQPLKVLLVEDHPDTSRVMTRLLQNLNHDVLHADSVQAARKLADAHAFDMVISDIGLPDGTGAELMRHLREKHALKGIAMSGFGMETDVKRSLDAGFHAHLTKPVNLDLLEAAISEVAAVKQVA